MRTAEDTLDVLSTAIQCLLQSNSVIAQRLASIEVGLGVTTENQAFTELENMNQVVGLMLRNAQGFAFEEEDAAACLLRYLKRLPEPVVPFDFYENFTSIDLLHNHEGSAFINKSNLSKPHTISLLQLYIAELLPLSRQLLVYLLDTLAVLVFKSGKNKMTPSRIVTAFQPSLLAREPSIGMSADDHRRAALTLVFMIENQDEFMIGIHGAATDATGISQDDGAATTPEDQEMDKQESIV